MNYIDIDYPNLRIHQRSEYSKIVVDSQTNDIIYKKIAVNDFLTCENKQTELFSINDNIIIIDKDSINENNLIYLFIPEGSADILCDSPMTFTKDALRIDAFFIPKNIRTINCEHIFENSHLQFVHIPENVTDLKSTTFKGCIFLTKAIIDANIDHIPAQLFQNTSLDTVHLSDSIEFIKPYAFAGCVRLESITLPKKLSIIYNNAFYDSGLKSITIPESVDKIGCNAFASTKLEEVIIPKNVKLIRENAFDTCYLKKVTLENINDIKIKKNAFNNQFDDIEIIIKENDKEKALNWIEENKCNFAPKTMFKIEKQKSLDDIINNFSTDKQVVSTTEQIVR